MTGFTVVFALMAPCLAAIGISRFAQSRIARRVLITGALYFLIVIFLAFMFALQCIGGLIEGYTECRPSVLLPFAQTLAGPLLISFLGYVVIGPAIVLAAAIFEFLKRRTG